MIWSGWHIRVLITPTGFSIDILGTGKSINHRTNANDLSCLSRLPTFHLAALFVK